MRSDIGPTATLPLWIIAHKDLPLPRMGAAPQEDNFFQTRQLQDAANKVGSQRESTRERSNVLVLVRFDQFWSKYPKHIRKSKAKREWLKLKVEDNTELFVEIMDGLQRAMNYWESVKQVGRFLPNAVTFLAERQWEDEHRVAPPQQIVSRQTEGILSATERFMGRHHTGENQ
jgi:hypothetical protein